MRRLCCVVGLLFAVSIAVYAEENVFVYDNYDSGTIEKKDFENGELVATPTMDSSPGSLKASTMAGNQYFGIGISRNLRQRPKTKVGTVLFFCYRTDTISTFKIQINCDSKNGNIVYIFRSVPGIWVPMYIPMTAMTFGNNASADVPGTELRSINIYGGKPGETFDFFIDNLLMFYDAPPQPMAAVIAREKQSASEVAGSLSQQRYTLSQELIYRIRAARAAAPKPPNPKTIMTAGSNAANNSDFILRLKNDDLKGCTSISTSHATGTSKNLAWVKENLEKNIPKDLPEIVFVLPGVEDVMANVPNDAIVKTLREIVDLCHANGAAVVLCSCIERLGTQLPQADAAQKINSLIPVVAEEKMVPFLDASSLINADQKKNFSTLKPTPGGYKAVNAKASKLYKTIEHWAFDRREEEPQVPGETGTPKPSTPSTPDTKPEDLDKVEI